MQRRVIFLVSSERDERMRKQPLACPGQDGHVIVVVASCSRGVDGTLAQQQCQVRICAPQGVRSFGVPAGSARQRKHVVRLPTTRKKAHCGDGVKAAVQHAVEWTE